MIIKRWIISLCFVQTPALSCKLGSVDVLIIIASRCRPLGDGFEGIEFKDVLDDLFYLEIYALFFHLQFDLFLCYLLNTPDFLYFLTGVTYVYHRTALFLLLDVLELFLGGLIFQELSQTDLLDL